MKRRETYLILFCILVAGLVLSAAAASAGSNPL